MYFLLCLLGRLLNGYSFGSEKEVTDLKETFVTDWCMFVWVHVCVTAVTRYDKEGGLETLSGVRALCVMNKQ